MTQIGARLLANLHAVAGPSGKGVRSHGLMLAVEMQPDAR